MEQWGRQPYGQRDWPMPEKLQSQTHKPPHTNVPSPHSIPPKESSHFARVWRERLSWTNLDTTATCIQRRIYSLQFILNAHRYPNHCHVCRTFFRAKLFNASSLFVSSYAELVKGKGDRSLQHLDAKNRLVTPLYSSVVLLSRRLILVKSHDY